MGAREPQAHEGHGHEEEKAQIAISTVSGERAQRLPDGAVFVPKTVQRIFALRTLLAENAEHKKVTELPGRIIPDPNASGYVQSAVGGRLSAAAGRLSPIGHTGEARRHPGLCHAAHCGDRCFRHAAAPGRTRSANLDRRTQVRPLRATRAVGRDIADPTRGHAARAGRAARPARIDRKIAPRARSADRAGCRRDRRRQRRGRPDRSAELASSSTSSIPRGCGSRR